MAINVRIVFTKSASVYDSYGDFWRLVEASGFNTIPLNDLNLTQQDTIYIVTPWNGEVTPTIQRERATGATNAKIVWLVLERVIDAGVVTPEVEAAIQLVDAVWVTDRSYLKLDHRFQHVVLGSHPALTAMPPQPTSQYDVSPLAYLWGRRQDVIQLLRNRGVRIAPDAYGGPAQDQILSTTRLMLNMHQYDTARIVAPLRFAVAAAYHLPLLSEPITDPWPLTAGRDFLAAPYDDLVEATIRLLADPSARIALATNLRQALTETYRFDTMIRRAAEVL